MARQIKRTKFLISVIVSSTVVFFLSFFSLGSKESSVLFSGLFDKSYADIPVEVNDGGGCGDGCGGSAGCM